MRQSVVICTENEEECGKRIRHQHHCIEYPQIVQTTNDSLEFGWYFDVDVLVEAWLKTALCWQRWPIVAPYAGLTVAQLFLTPFQLLCLSFQLLLASLWLCDTFDTLRHGKCDSERAATTTSTIKSTMNGKRIRRKKKEKEECKERWQKQLDKGENQSSSNGRTANGKRHTVVNYLRKMANGSGSSLRDDSIVWKHLLYVMEWLTCSSSVEICGTTAPPDWYAECIWLFW